MSDIGASGCDPHPTFSLRGITRTGLPLVDAPEVLLPSQLPTGGRAVAGKIAEYRLLLAVLEDAVHCFQQFLRPKNQKERMLFADAEAWIMDRNQATGHRTKPHAPFLSFEYVCEVLNLEPESVCEQLRRWRQLAADGTNNQGVHDVKEYSRLPPETQRRVLNKGVTDETPSHSHASYIRTRAAR